MFSLKTLRVVSFERCSLFHVLLLSCRQASRVLCATLAIPLPNSGGRLSNDQLLDLDDSGIEKQKRLAALLSLTNLPSRQSLVRDLVSFLNKTFSFLKLQNLVDVAVTFRVSIAIAANQTELVTSYVVHLFKKLFCIYFVIQDFIIAKILLLEWLVKVFM